MLQGRPAYQTISEDKSSNSKHGQIISNVYNGHLSVNHNGVINSATKRIESKIDDVFQLENNIIEQNGVIENLELDYIQFSESQLPELYKDVYDTISSLSITKIKLDFVKNGVGLHPDDPSTLNTLVTTIRENKKSIKRANELQTKTLDEENEYLKDLTDFINTEMLSIEEEYSVIQILKSKVNGKLETN